MDQQPNLPVPVAESVALAPRSQLSEAAKAYARANLTASTWRAYRSAWSAFISWCAGADRCELPADPSTVAEYLAERAPHIAPSTLARHLAAIVAHHDLVGATAPSGAMIDEVLRGARRTHGRPPQKKRALVTADLRKVVGKLPDTLAGVRDRAILLVGFAAAERRSELAAMTLDGADAGDVVCRFVSEGLEIHFGRSKGDQEGRGAVVAVPFGKSTLCPVKALRAWLEAAKIRSGHVFRRIDRHGNLGPDQAMAGKAFAEVVKRSAGRAGFDPARYGGHSLRRGLITSSHQAGADLDRLRRHVRHKRIDTTLDYVEEADRFDRKNAAGKAGL